MPLLWLALALFTANTIDVLVHALVFHQKEQEEKPRHRPTIWVGDIVCDMLDGSRGWAIGILGVLALIPIVRLLCSPWWGLDPWLLLGAASYGAIVVATEPKGRAFLHRWFGKAWAKIRKRLPIPERLRLSEQEKVLRGLEAGLLAQIGDSPLLAPLADSVRHLVRTEAPHLTRLELQNAVALDRVLRTLAETEHEPDSPERRRSVEIRARLHRRLDEQSALLAQLRHKLVHLGPVIEDVRTSLEAGDQASVASALRYLDDLTSAIHASVAEDASALPAADIPADDAPPLPSRTRASS